MRLQEALLVSVVLSGIFFYPLVQGDRGSDFLDYKEKQVQLIGEQARANHEQKCELVSSCSEPTQCSRGGCSPRKEDKLSCAAMVENNKCFENSTCDNIRVNYDRSYVRYPKYDYDKSSSSGADMPGEVRDSICSQRKLDQRFGELLAEQRAVNQNTSEDYYFNFYFGSVDGAMRFYPGLEVKDCNRFDPRLRPWYLGAISVVKEVVVLLDKGESMSKTIGAVISATAGEIADILTQQFLLTLTQGDNATVITFDSTGADRLVDFVVPDTGLNVSDPDFTSMYNMVNETRTVNSGKSNYTAALREGVSTFTSNSDDLKIILLFTDGQGTVPTGSQLATIVQELEDRSIRLFIYEISDARNSTLGPVACQSKQGYHVDLETLRVLQNPLYSLNSYFTFLARSNIQTIGSNRPYWQPVYVDYGNLGSIVTVAYPVMSSDDRLIGVAAIDMQTAGLDPILKNQIENNLSERRKPIPQNSLGAPFTNCSVGPGNDGDCQNQFLQPICQRTDQKSSYKDLLCCGKCSIPKKSNTRTTLLASLLSVAAVLVFTGGLGTILYFRCRRNGPAAQPPIVDIVKVPKFSYEQLYLATDRFSESNRVGQGTFGTVYRGTLDDGKKVAVKKLNFRPDPELKNFEAEIRVLATANHNNLLALKGYCVDKEYMLVYEFLENGDLDQWLFQKSLSGQVLNWSQRVAVAKGTAKGLAYLHEELQNDQTVCHSDIKPANILLDKDFNPKVADFGMAKLYGRGDNLISVEGGTFGYMAPEILEGASADTKADVYSYGMVLLEMVTGRRISECKSQNLRHWANMQVVEGRESNTIDPLLKGLDEDDLAAARNLLNIAICCTMRDPDGRPDMSLVVKMIEGFHPVPFNFSDEGSYRSGTSNEFAGLTGESIQWDGSWTMSQVFNRIHSEKAQTKGEV
ncbi:hypothetical protein R1sor_001235 [Riccia sorocarpa]|uniref:non-specific serine/threonine protein kinase n=1 Tax=Riccia sorocarpa TaxID=122646 RepID=A0ABD3GW97_9MARC